MTSLAALLIATILIGAAGYMDYRKIEMTRLDLQAAADAAALDGASLINAMAGSRENNARVIFDRQYSAIEDAVPIDQRDAVALDGQVTVTAEADVPMMFLKFIGQSTRRVTVEASAPYDLDAGAIEI